MAKLIVVPHDPTWRESFNQEAKLITAALQNNLAAIHHIGSTAIPNIYAKPVIDILVEVKDITEVNTRVPAMESLGYESMGEFGIPGRRYFRKDNAEGIRTHQVHIFESGSPQIIRHLAFRDYLTSHRESAAEYSNLKRTLADEHSDNPDAYMDGKDEFIKDIDSRAQTQ